MTNDQSCLTPLYIAQARAGKTYAKFLLDTNGTILSWNAGVEQVLGYSEFEFVGQPMSILFTPEDQSHGVPDEELRTAVKNADTGDCLRWHVRKDGQLIFVEGIVTALHDPSGSLIGFSKIMRDATDRHIADHRLRTKKEQLEQLAEMLSLAHAIVRQPDGTILLWNQGLTRMYGWSEEEASGRISHELLKTEFPQPLEEIERVLLRDDQWQGELKHTTKSGSVLIIESHWALRRDAVGNPLSITEINSDITERKRSEDALRTSEATVRALLENASQGIITIDSTGQIEHANAMAEKLFGYGRKELIGSRLEMLLPDRFQ